MPPKRFPNKKPAPKNHPNTNNATQEPQTQEKDEKYEKEVAWCIEQLEIGLKRPNVTKEQEKESKSVIAKLKSNQIPKVQKRHLMHVVFGDYRKHMAEQAKNEQQSVEK